MHGPAPRGPRPHGPRWGLPEPHPALPDQPDGGAEGGAASWLLPVEARLSPTLPHAHTRTHTHTISGYDATCTTKTRPRDLILGNLNSTPWPTGSDRWTASRCFHKTSVFNSTQFQLFSSFIWTIEKCIFGSHAWLEFVGHRDHRTDWVMCEFHSGTHLPQDGDVCLKGTEMGDKGLAGTSCSIFIKRLATYFWEFLSIVFFLHFYWPWLFFPGTFLWRT